MEKIFGIGLGRWKLYLKMIEKIKNFFSKRIHNTSFEGTPFAVSSVYKENSELVPSQVVDLNLWKGVELPRKAQESWAILLSEDAKIELFNDVMTTSQLYFRQVGYIEVAQTYLYIDLQDPSYDLNDIITRYASNCLLAALCVDGVCSAPQQEILDNTRKTISNMESTYRFKFALGGRIAV